MRWAALPTSSFYPQQLYKPRKFGFLGIRVVFVAQLLRNYATNTTANLESRKF